MSAPTQFVLEPANTAVPRTPQANHPVKGAIDETLRCKAEGRDQSISFNLCGHGHPAVPA